MPLIRHYLQFQLRSCVRVSQFFHCRSFSGFPDIRCISCGSFRSGTCPRFTDLITEPVRILKDLLMTDARILPGHSDRQPFTDRTDDRLRNDLPLPLSEQEHLSCIFHRLWNISYGNDSLSEDPKDSELHLPDGCAGLSRKD